MLPVENFLAGASRSNTGCADEIVGQGTDREAHQREQDRREHVVPARLRHLARAVLCALTVFVSLRGNGGLISGGLKYTRDMDALSRIGFFSAMARCLKAREFWYVFAWLLPVGLMRIKQMDRRWAWAVAGTSLLALILGSYNDALGNTSRALFNIAGPLLSLSAAQFLVRANAKEAQKGSEVEVLTDQRRRA